MNDLVLLGRSLYAQPVRTLQYMLRRLSTRYPFLPLLVDTGTFDETTLEAVMRFQRQMGLPVTGVVDLRTWELMRDMWLGMEMQSMPPRPLRPFPDRDYRVTPGMAGDYIVLPQTIFQILAQRVDGIETSTPDGVHLDASVRNVQWLQRVGGLEPNGVLDGRTWDLLVRLYEMLISTGRSERGRAVG